jgi:hypothetical protein
VGRMVAVADVFDALTHDRPYKPAWPADQAIALIRSSAGSQFDPRVVDAFLAIISEHGPVETGGASAPARRIPEREEVDAGEDSQPPLPPASRTGAVGRRPALGAR